MSKPGSLRLLNHALGGPEGASCCEKLVEAAGLKPTFALFMKKQDKENTEHLLGMLASMLRSLPANEAPRIRLLAKFVEKDYQACDRLIKLRREYASKVAVIDREIKQERARLDGEEANERTDEWFSRRLDAGLYVLQTVDVILAWLVAEDDGARRKIQALADRDDTLKDIEATLKGRFFHAGQRRIKADQTRRTNRHLEHQSRRPRSNAQGYAQHSDGASDLIINHTYPILALYTQNASPIPLPILVTGYLSRKHAIAEQNANGSFHALQNPPSVFLQSQILLHHQLRRSGPSPSPLDLLAQFNLQHPLRVSTPPRSLQLWSCIRHAHPKRVAAFLDRIRAYAFLTPWRVSPFDEF